MKSNSFFSYSYILLIKVEMSSPEGSLFNFQEQKDVLLLAK